MSKYNRSKPEDDTQSRLTGYSYNANSNLVIQSDQPRSKTSKEPTGEPESLKDKLFHGFGDQVTTSRLPTENKEKKEKSKKRTQSDDNQDRPTKKTRVGSVLDADEMEGIKYQPRTRETRQQYESLLHFVRQKVGDQPQSVIMSAADEVLVILKDEEIRPKEKQGLLEELLNALTPDNVSDLFKISNAITDYTDDLGGEREGEDEVAVVFGDDDEDEDDEENYDIDEEDSEEGDMGDIETEIKESVTTGEAGENENQLDLDPNVIGGYWLQRELTKFFEDAHQSQKMASEVMDILSKTTRFQELENELVGLLGYLRFDFIKLLLLNRKKIVYCTKLGQAQSAEEREAIEEEMSRVPELLGILQSLKGGKSQESGRETQISSRAKREQRALSKHDSSSRRDKEQSLKLEAMDILEEESKPAVPVSEFVDLESLSFAQGSHLMSNKNCNLPDGSFHNVKKGYEEVSIPAVKAPPLTADEKIIPVSSIPQWAQAAFPKMKEFNRIQSKVFKSFFEGNENLLLCAPTGGGKTNCAMLAMMHQIGLHLKDKETLEVELDTFKMIYIAPMKSLVQEMVTNFGKRLKPYGINVAELTGDSALTKEQIAQTQLIITTPEKWDIITRKSGDRTYTSLVRLIIIDEIHLLHDDRGPVLESIVARTIRQIETTQEMVRIIGLSATLPNYQDVATFLRVKPNNLFAFPNNLRPVPLEQTYVGISVKRPFKRFQMMNDICYEKVQEHAGVNQVLVFVHSRKETFTTAQMLRDKAIGDNSIGKFLGDDPASREILISESENIQNAELKDLLPYGFAVHHAGLTKEDRTLVEDLFADRNIQVLVSTATLAWGVNLPAHAVIIKGTKIYSPEAGDWIELSPLDVMQMMGRAGRIEYDLKGKGVLITGRQELQYYLSLLHEQLPIESQFITKLADNLNAEIVLGTVQNAKEAVNWLGYTYLYVCMLRSPELYGIAPSERDRDKRLKQRRYDLVHAAATILSKNSLINYDRKSGNFQVTDLGRIASHYYIAHHSMAVYNEHLKPTMGDIELLKVFSLSSEFKNVAVRPDEREELKRLLDRVPIPVKESIDEPSAKINVLFQAYVSRLTLDGFSLASDMVFIRQSAGRIMRALFEIALKRGWAALAERCLKFCQMIEHRIWGTQTELRQFKAPVSLPLNVLKSIEKKALTIEKLYPLDAHQIGTALDNPGIRKNVHTLVRKFPRLDLSASVQPITRSLLRVDLTITPDFTFDEELHGPSLAFWIIVKDVDGDTILHHEMFVLKKAFATEEHHLTFTVPLFEILPPQYFIKIVSDRWMGSETTLAVSFRHLILPEKNPPHTDLLDLQPLPVPALKNASFESLYKEKFTYFNPIQTQVFNTLYNTDQNVLLCAPSGSGKTVCAEFAILREWTREEPGKIVYVAPLAAIAKNKYSEWSMKFEPLEKTVSLLTGDWTVDSKLLARADIAIATPEQWDAISRRWNKRKVVQNIKLFIFDELHLIGYDDGPTLEVVVSRVRYIAQQMQLQWAAEQKSAGANTIGKQPPFTRIVALSTSLANAKDIGEWIGANPQSLFNFHPNVRPVPLEIHIQGFDSPSFKARILSMNRLLMYSISHHAEDKPVIVFVPSRKLSRDIAKDLITHTSVEQSPKRYLHCSVEDLQPLLQRVESRALRESLSLGVGFYNEAMAEGEKEVVMHLFSSGAIQVLIATHSTAWEINTSAHLVVVMGTEYYEGKEHTYVDYQITKLLQMIGRAGVPGTDASAKCIIFGHSRKKEFYKKFIHEPLPIESHLDHYLQDHFNAEIVTRTIENKQDAVDYLTWTFYYRRITQNPNYYNLQGVSHMMVSDHLSELVESTLKDLEDAKCVLEDDSDLTPVNLGIIASYYYIRYTTIELFNFSLTKTTKLKGLIQIISNASEFEGLTIRHKEDQILQKLAAHLPHQIAKPDYNSVATKVNILLQSFFSRRVLPADLMADQREVLLIAPRLIQAIVDVISSNGWLAPALAAMELAQMLVQAMWIYESRLKQLPHFSQEFIDRFNQEEPKCKEVSDIIELEDERREHLLRGLSKSQLADVAGAVNRYPSIEMEFDVQNAENIKVGDTVHVAIKFEREMDGKLGPVYAPFYPGEKVEGWWAVIGDIEKNVLHAIKRITVAKPEVLEDVEFEAPAQGDHKLMLYFLSDSYFGADLEWEIDLKVLPKSEDEMDVEPTKKKSSKK